MPAKPGIEVLLDDKRDLLQGRLGVLTHPAAVDSALTHIVDRLIAEPDFEVTALFGPQHGIWGQTQDNMIEWEGFRDDRLRIPVFSLYGEHRKPAPEMLVEIDTLLIDLQDVGARYYTFAYTMALAMQACHDTNKNVIVVDRPNPLGGIQLEGPVLDPLFSSFVGLYPLPIRHGMTIGELALYFNDAGGIELQQLDVVPIQGWTRDHYFDETGLPWVMPSPNLPTLDSAIVYPGLCLLEGTNVSEGRGTTRPFELCGAPWIDPHELVNWLTDQSLPGCRFRPLYFEPTFHKWKNQSIGGVQIHVTDRHSFLPFRTGLTLICGFRKFGPGDFDWKNPPYEYEYERLPFDILCGTDQIRKGLEEDCSVSELEAMWKPDLSEFERIRRNYLLY